MMTTKTGMRQMAMDSARIRRAVSTPSPNYLAYAKVGHVDPTTGSPEPNPAFVRIESGQILVEVTLTPEGDELVARYGMDGAGDGVADYSCLTFGCRVIVEFVRGSTQNAVIVATLNDKNCPFPSDVCGVQTGAAAAEAPESFAPAPAWRFIKMGAGQLLAIETQGTGDILIHSAGSMHLKATTHHLDGRVALGVPPTTPPVGGTVLPGGQTSPAVPAVPAVPVPATPSSPATPLTIVPYSGFQDGIVRAKDAVQSHAGVDPAFWAWIAAVAAHPVIAPVAGPGPIALHSEHGGRNGPGSQHTASD